jgi:ClpP class serine protease
MRRHLHDPSARVGSIGVIMALRDTSEAFGQMGVKVEVFAAGKFKSTGTPGVALSDEQKTWLQSDVEEIAADFRQAVLTRGRNIPAEAMEGQTFFARKAEQYHLASAVKNRAELLRMIRARHLS